MNIRGVTMAGLVALSMLGCASRGPTASTAPVLTDPEAIAAAQARQATREAWLASREDWSFEGRVAVNAQGKGGSGRIDWQQRGDAYQVALSAPVTRQSWRLMGDLHSDAGRLEGLEGGPREGEDAEVLLTEATGWDIPLQALVRWTRGLADAEFRSDGPGEQAYSLEGNLRSLRQQGWRVEFTDWFPPQGERPAMPRRIDATRDGASVRLVVDQWNFETP